jgi:hypothetical protein
MPCDIPSHVTWPTSLFVHQSSKVHKQLSPLSKGYSAPEKIHHPPFGCRNDWGFEKSNSENFPATGCVIT